MSTRVKLGLMGVIVICAAVGVVAAVGNGNLMLGATAPEKIPGPGGGANPPLELAGGETCATATVIPGLPYTDSGTTAGAVNNYDQACPFTGSTAPDVVYAYTPASNQIVTVSLCNPGTATDYDTKVYVYESTCPGTVTGCSDDACSSPLYNNYVSEVQVTLNAGTTYYIVVDGYGSSSGNYTLSLEEYIVQTCPCPGNSDLFEATLDPLCGNDPAGDPTGGCNTDPANPGPYMIPISCNMTICGTTSTFTSTADSRDTDWYELVLPGADTIRVTLQSQAHLYLFDLSGEYDCANVAVAQIYEEFGNCAGSGEMVVAGAAGPNWLWVGPTVYGAAAGITCPTEYILTVDCDFYPVELQSLSVE
ncbi:MAG: hypothetical protein MUC56_10535 [Thermoanaerobaculales bacterium]|nr:hypothetical protein [Thermoanaerobaculales bacterium]